MPVERLLSVEDIAGQDTKEALRALGFTIVGIEKSSPLGEYYRVNLPKGWRNRSGMRVRDEYRDWFEDETGFVRIRQIRDRNGSRLEFFVPKSLTAKELLRITLQSE